MHKRQRLGAHGEDLAADHLSSVGLQVVQRNWRTSLEGVRGELDIIALEGRTLAVVEVKTRTSSHAGTAVQAVGWAKRRQLRRLTTLYLADHPHPGPVRGDVVTLDWENRSGRWRIRHMRGAW